MRKEITFQQCQAKYCLVHVKNIFDFSVNYIQDKIKKHNGQWSNADKKYRVPIYRVEELGKQLQAIDQTFYIALVPSIVGETINRHSCGGKKIKKQILIDEHICKRFEYIQCSIIRNIIQNGNNCNTWKNYHKILVVCPEIKINTWFQCLKKYNGKILNCGYGQIEQCLKQNAVWICSFELVWMKADQLLKYCFQTFIIDDSQILARKLSASKEPALCFSRLLTSRHFVFPIVSKTHLNNLQVLVPLLELIAHNDNFGWLMGRYKKQNIGELKYLLNSSSFTRDINYNKKIEFDRDVITHHINKILIKTSESGKKKLEILNKKNTQIQYRKLLQNPQMVKNKIQKIYLSGVMEVFKDQKMQSICTHINFLCCQLKLKLAVIIDKSSTYKTIQNYLCEQQIAYCHFEHHHTIINYNKNPSMLVCLIKQQYLLSINYLEPVPENQLTGPNSQLDNYQPQQYLCLSGVRNIVFPDVQWTVDIKKKQQALSQLMRHSHSDLIRHYYILKDTYEEKWMKKLQETAQKIQQNLQILAQQQKDDKNQNNNQTFFQLNLQKVQAEYSHLLRIKKIVDIDQQFDKLEFKVLQQKIKRQEKKQKQNNNKAEKQEEKELMQKDNFDQGSHLKSIEILLAQKEKSFHTNQNIKVKIYQPIFQHKNFQSKQNSMDAEKTILQATTQDINKQLLKQQYVEMQTQQSIPKYGDENQGKSSQICINHYQQSNENKQQKMIEEVPKKISVKHTPSCLND